MNILFISPADPRLSHAGYAQRTNLLWQVLKEIGNVYTIVYSDTHVGAPILIEDSNPIYILNPKSFYNIKKAFEHRVINYLTGIPFTHKKFPCEYKVSSIYKEIKFDIVVSRYIHLPAKFHLWETAPLYIDVDDHPLQVYNTIIKHNRPKLLHPISRLLLNIQFNIIINKTAGSWISNKQQVTNNKKLNYLPNIPFPPNAIYRPHYEDRKYLLTVGLMSYQPNYDGVDRFLSSIWPKFHKQHPDIKYFIGGKGAPIDYAERWNSIEGVSYLGFIENLEEAYEKCIAALVPIYSGAGTCIKTLEAMAYSRICISTPYGARGIDLEDTKKENGLFIFKTPEEFINIYENISTPRTRTKLEEKAFEYIKQNYSFEKFKNIISKTIGYSQK